MDRAFRILSRRTITPQERDLSRRTVLCGTTGRRYQPRLAEELKKPKPFPEYEFLHAPLSSWRDPRRDFVRGTAIQEIGRDPKWREFALRRSLLKGLVTLPALVIGSLAFEKARARAFLRAGGIAAAPGFLPSGHWFVNQAMVQIYPVPSAAANAAHLNIYYDGVNAVPWYNGIPIGVAFGAYPYVVTAATLAPWMSIGKTYGGANYLRITGTPTGAWSSAISVTLTGQDLSTLTTSWTPVTTSALTKFIFMATGGSSSNNGSFGAPFDPGFIGAFGSASTTVANAGALCFIRAGAYTLPASSDTPNHFAWDTVNKPAGLIQYPGESVTITTGGTPASPSAGVNFVCQNNGSETFVQGITLNGYDSTNANYKLFAHNGPGGSTDRVTFDQVTWDNAGYGSTGTDNPSMIVTQQSTSPYHTNFYLNQLTENGRQSGMPGNNFALASLYTVTGALIENCTVNAPSSAIDGACYLKSDIYNGSVRGCKVTVASCNYAFGYAQQIVGTMGTNETCYNYGLGVQEIYAPATSGVGPFWVERNSIYTYSGTGIGLMCHTGTAVFNNNAVNTSYTPVPNGSGSYTGSGNLVGTSVLNSNGTLVNSAYFGTVGAGIG